ncbi:MAG TPA: D-alanyl-D-alanine carboxypeptidase, partial [Chitinophagaceae bacterium]|nr:D-alanyl-D-alanine carboxypeptidase [Chitinophagaceae bacterium]
WIWQDIGNYYGAGAHQLNWHENQYDLVLSSGDNVGDDVTVVSPKKDFVNQLKTAAKGTGDNAYIYLPEGAAGRMLLAGTIPAGERSFTISGATTDPAGELKAAFTAALASKRISIINEPAPQKTPIIFYTHYSPPLDSINFWFLRRSINLYGEALMKTIGKGSTDTGVHIVRDLWAAKGIDRSAINIIDGSGLSPQNRVTTDALAHILYYAQDRPWFASFYEALPAYNNMKLKSGSIGGARAFAGYHTSAQGTAYIVAIIVNNYAGSSGEIVKKMYRVLDVLK